MTDRPHETSRPPLAGHAERSSGYGPNDTKKFVQRPYHHPAAGWGAATSVGKVLAREREPVQGVWAMLRMNHPTKGFDCPGCAWPDDPGVALDICENGIKHVTWEMTPKRTTPEFFADHTVSQLRSWSDFALEDQGRLTHPMRYDASTDHYLPIDWAEAFALVGEHLQRVQPHEAAFYTSGRLSNEATFLYQLLAREYGTNNLPDCSNMCHEASGRALQASLGTGVGTADLADWEKADALFVLGVNVASNAPRMLTTLAEAHRRGAKIVHINPLVEAGATRTIVPHEMVDMALFRSTPTSTLNLQVRPAGDLALLRGIAKAVFEAADDKPDVLDQKFLDHYTQGFAEYRSLVEGAEWAELERQSGLSKPQILAAADIYLNSERTIVSWCLGITQHEHSVDTAREIVNLLLLRGNVGREGAGPSPVRGHSNVQGNRTCGIDHRPTDDFLDRLGEHFRFEPPRHHGMDTIATLQAMYEGRLQVFFGMGGNFARATPDPAYTETGLANCALTVQVSTKLNRSHLAHGRDALILPCLGRTERDLQETGQQSVSCEDSMSSVQLSKGSRQPAAPQLMSEAAIVAGIARAALPQSKTRWDWYVADYDRVRDAMAQVIPRLAGYNQKVRQPMGFRVQQPARDRVFLTASGRAEFCLAPLHNEVPDDPDVLVLQTFRSQDQWNTTIYSDNDRYRGIKNLRTLVFLNEQDMKCRRIDEGDLLSIEALSKDGTRRQLRGFRAVKYDLPEGSCAGYMPEMNALIGPADFSAQSDQPLMKNLKVLVARL
ncbi:FdhF/YdeP family oxidoreductase [Flexivirga caeni]|uniref:Formate dehydrogenase n=1 Tax=Flexivirga caeni TaxID=2294115 RepID=A0A3M9MFS2_9MICO|nr:FdhF/YdeP family oxidoreductase [Flexivirga caeni]RNI24386.1 formate dehydrogenase [Flexivirga caeni]